MPDRPDTQVLIVGGGIGGLMLAAILRRLAISCIVLERSESLTPVGAGISLAPNALAVLDQLGLYDAIQREGQALRGMRVHHNKELWREIDFTGVKTAFNYPVYSIERCKLHELLHEAAGGDAGVRWGTRVADIVDKPECDRVIVKTAENKFFTADVVVGADGIRSATRRVLAKNVGLESINTIQFTGRVHMSGYTRPMESLGEKELGVGNWLFYDDAILTSWPCKDNAQWFIGVKRVPPGEKDPDRSVWEGATQDTVNEVYGDKFHPYGANQKASDMIDHSTRVIASNVFEEKDFPSMVSGRVALLGDAAHSMTSFFGQGACQAIEDATELANELRKHFDFPTPASLGEALERYADVRGKRGKALVRFSSTYAGIHVARLPGGMGPFARQLLFKWLPVWMWLWALAWLYGYQPTVQKLAPGAETKVTPAKTSAAIPAKDEKTAAKEKPSTTKVTPAQPTPVKSVMHAVKVDPVQMGVDLKALRNQVALQTQDVAV